MHRDSEQEFIISCLCMGTGTDITRSLSNLLEHQQEVLSLQMDNSQRCLEGRMGIVNLMMRSDRRHLLIQRGLPYPPVRMQ